MTSGQDQAARRLVRAPHLRAYDHGDEMTVLGADGIARRLSGDSAALARAVLEIAAVPAARGDILARIAELAGEPVELGGVVDEAIDTLFAVGALCEASAPAPHEAQAGGAPAHPDAARRRVVLALSGAIASMTAPLAVERLQARGFDVRVAATRNALRFVRALSLEALTHAPVSASLWPSDPRTPVPHLELAAWADLVLVYPASASTLARIAQGLCSDIVSALAVSARCPVLIVPSMNDAMVTAHAVQRNLDQLRDDGFYIVHPVAGVEVADAPADRRPARGPAPPASAVIDLVESILAERPVPVPAPAAPAAPAPWDDIYGAADPHDLPWFTESLDADLAALIPSAAPGALLLDIGTGLGTAAIEAARRGLLVVATDTSARALALARDRADALPIVWCEDDICNTRLQTSFDVVIDRACLHVLPDAQHPAYASAVAALTKPGGLLILKCHAPDAPPELGTRRFDEPAVAALLGDAFELQSAVESTLPGPTGEGPPALLCLLRRR